MISWAGRAQDERIFRDIISPEKIMGDSLTAVSPPKVITHTNEYLIDINGDGNQEILFFVKKDCEDFLYLYDYQRNKKFEYKFELKGINARPYRVALHRIDGKTNVLLIYYYEGESNYIDLRSSVKLYFLTIDNQDLDSVYMYKGPMVFEEFKFFKSQYHLKNYEITFADLNNDGRNKIIVKNRGISQVFFYKEKGIWETFRTD